MTDAKSAIIQDIQTQFHARGILTRHKTEGTTDEFVTGPEDEDNCHLRLQLFADGPPEADLAFLHSFSKGMGLATMCAVIGALQERNYERLYLIELIADGFSFWPWLGAVAADNRAPDADHVVQTVNMLKGHGAIDAAEADRLTNVFNLEAVQGKEAWHRLSSIDHPTKIERAVIGGVTELALPSQKIMVLDLTDPVVNARLEKRFADIRPPSHKA